MPIYKQINVLIKNEFTEDFTKDLKNNYKDSNSNNFNFLNIINKEYEETVYTNMLGYYFNKKLNNGKILFNDFLENEGIKTNNYKEVKREYVIPGGRMDLASINEPEKTVVIIENKINSGLNGKKGENNGTQLKTYYNYYKKHQNYDVVDGLIFVPDYNLKKLEIEIDKKENNDISENYKVIPYSKLLEYFQNFENEKYYKKNFEDFSDYKYYEDFLSTLALHSKNAEDKMTEKFVKVLSKNNLKDIEYYVLILKAKIKPNGKKARKEYYVETTNNIVKREEELRKYKKDRRNNNAKYKNIENINPILEIKVNPAKKGSNEVEDIEYVFKIENQIRDEIVNKISKASKDFINEFKEKFNELKLKDCEIIKQNNY